MSPSLVAGVTDTNVFTDLFVRDLETDTTFLVTRNIDDTAGQFSFTYEWTPDGSAIVFESPSDKLVAGVTDTNLGNDVFLWTSPRKKITILSVDPAGTTAGDEVSHIVDVGTDGRYVAFASASTNLTPESAGGDVQQDLYVRDTANGHHGVRRPQRVDERGVGLARLQPRRRALALRERRVRRGSRYRRHQRQAGSLPLQLATGEKSVVTINADATATGDTLAPASTTPSSARTGVTSRSSARRPIWCPTSLRLPREISSSEIWWRE